MPIAVEPDQGTDPVILRCLDSASASCLVSTLPGSTRLAKPRQAQRSIFSCSSVAAAGWRRHRGLGSM